MILPGAPRAALFDVDGTLVDTVRYEASAWLEALRTADPAMTFARVLKQMGKGADHLLPALLPPDVVARRRTELSSLQTTLFREKYRPLVRPFPGVRALFERLRAAGTTIALASSGDRADIDHYQALTGTADLVSFIVSADDVAHSKPSADVFATAMRRLDGLLPTDALAVGDTPYDAQAAAAAGIATVGVTCGGAFSRRELLDAGCIAVREGPADLIALFRV